MSISRLIAKHIKEVYIGDNWTCVNLKETLQDVSWQHATTQVHSFNTIAVLLHHMNYYVEAVTKVLKGETLNAKDSDSFTHPPIQNEQDWENMKAKSMADVEVFSHLIEALPDSRLEEIFEQEKYGNYFRNLIGIIEHFHYHLGQIVLIKKILLSK